MKKAETRALVLSKRNYREKDRLVKMFTESFGKRTFFVRGREAKLSSAIQDFTLSRLTVTINESGFSFISDVSDLMTFKNIAQDIFLNAYASHVMSLADMAVSDQEYDPALFAFLIQVLQLMDQGLDQEILSHIFELQILSRFGTQLNLSECLICGRRDLPLDFSIRLGGCLCQDHFFEDPRRLGLDPNVLYLANQFTDVSLDSLSRIKVGPEMKVKLRQFIEMLYDEYVGLETKAKKFLDGMGDWAIF